MRLIRNRLADRLADWHKKKPLRHNLRAGILSSHRSRSYSNTMCTNKMLHIYFTCWRCAVRTLLPIQKRVQLVNLCGIQYTKRPKSIQNGWKEHIFGPIDQVHWFGLAGTNREIHSNLNVWFRNEIWWIKNGEKHKIEKIKRFEYRWIWSTYCSQVQNYFHVRCNDREREKRANAL